MKDIRCSVNPLITRPRGYKLLILVIISLLSVWRPVPLCGQVFVDPENAIKELKDGYLIIRFPTYKAKLDTLNAISARTTDPKNKERMQKEIQQTIEERDTLFADYIEAFKTKYTFSKVAYIFDYDARDLNTARYYNLDGEQIAVADLSELPLYYVLFDRTDVDALDALVVYNRNMRKVPKPFPNDFTRGGINFLFLKISDKKFPSWRVGKMNKRFNDFYISVQ
jgi:hypothetical protein